MMQLVGFPVASFAGAQVQLEPELEAMLSKTLTQGEAVYLKVQGNPAEALVVTRYRIIILKGAQRGQGGKPYGRFFTLENIIRFDCKGRFRTDFIAIITPETQRENIPIFNLWKCSFGITFSNDSGRSTAHYLSQLEQWINSQRRHSIIAAPLQPINPLGIVHQSNELFFLQIAATYFEEKPVKKYTSGSSSVSVPIARGIRMRVGGSKGQSTTQFVLQEDDSGNVAIGNQRVVFVGRRRNISVPLNAIASVEVFTDGFQFAISNKKAIQFRTNDDLPGLLLKRLLQIP